MTLDRYLLGVLLGGVALGPLHAASYLWRRRLITEWDGCRARLAELIADLTIIICVSEVLGTVHLYRLGPMVAVLAVIGVAGCWSATKWPRATADPDAEPEVQPDATAVPASSRGALVTAWVAVSVLMADWGTRTVEAYHHGMVGADTIWYHLPFAARFVQDGSTTALHYVDSEPVTVFFPASSELVHAFGILLMGNDVVSPVINTLWLGLALLAAWCIGRPFGVAPVTLTATAVLFATPGLVGTQPGGAYDDVVGIALLLSAIALLINARDLTSTATRVVWAVAAASAGLAVGTKFTFIAPVAALSVGAWFLVSRHKRWRDWGVWLVLVIATGGYFYVRNFAAVGNPLPSLHLKLGPINLASPPVATPTSTVAHYLFNGSDWHRYFLPGLRLSFGPAWWALLAVALIGLVAAIGTGGLQQRVFGLVGLATALIFLVTPQYLTILGLPVFFVDNVRYVDPALAVGMVLLPINPLLAPWRRARWLLGALCVILAATQLDGSIWPTTLLSQRFVDPVRGVDSLAGLLIGVALLGLGGAVLALRGRMPHWKLPKVGYLALGVVVLGCGFPIQQAYLHDRYTGTGGLGPVYSWAQHESHTRIGVIGEYAYLQYPLYGKDLTNHVQYLGVRGPHGAYGQFTSCTTWRRMIDAGRYSFVLITTNLKKTKDEVHTEPAPEASWTSEDPSTSVVLGGIAHLGAPFPGYVGFTLYRIDGRLVPSGCGAQTPVGQGAAAG